MSEIEMATKVESAVNQMAGISKADIESFEVTSEGIQLTLSISSAVEGSDDESDDASPSNSSAVDEGEDDDEADESSSSNSSAVDNEDDDEDSASSSNSSAVEVEEGKFRCPLCEDYEGSKAQVNGHKGHCDGSPSNSSAVDEGTDEGTNDTSSSNSSAVDNEEVPHPEEADNPTKENYKVHYGVCCKEDCDYGTNGADEDFCASHQNSSAVKEGSTEKSKVSYDDLTSGQQKAVNNLLEEKADDDTFGVEEAVQMV